MSLLLVNDRAVFVDLWPLFKKLTMNVQIIKEAFDVSETVAERLLPLIDEYTLVSLKIQQLRMKGSDKSTSLEDLKLHLEREISFIIEQGKVNYN